MARVFVVGISNCKPFKIPVKCELIVRCSNHKVGPQYTTKTQYTLAGSKATFLYGLYPNLCNVTQCNPTPSLTSQNPREQMCSIYIFLLAVTFPSHISWVLTLKKSSKECKAHSHTHHIVIIAMLTVCHSTMSNDTLISYHHASMLTLQTSVISRALCMPQVRVYLNNPRTISKWIMQVTTSVVQNREHNVKV